MFGLMTVCIGRLVLTVAYVYRTVCSGARGTLCKHRNNTERLMKQTNESDLCECHQKVRGDRWKQFWGTLSCIACWLSPNKAAHCAATGCLRLRHRVSRWTELQTEHEVPEMLGKVSPPSCASLFRLSCCSRWHLSRRRGNWTVFIVPAASLTQLFVMLGVSLGCYVI